jgi:CRISPR-associated protein Cmr1
MNKVSLTLETITPLFLSGNDQNAVEFRTASIRGQLRYWYRALLGGAIVAYYHHPEKLAEEISRREKEIFGTTDRGSRVMVRVNEIAPHSETRLSQRKFIQYLGYGLKERKAFSPGQKFRVDISLWKSSDVLESVVAATLWATLHLGNLGARSRRGFGSIGLADEASWGGLTMKRPTSFGDLNSQLEGDLKSVVTAFEKHTGNKYAQPPDLPPFSVLCPQYWKLMLLNAAYASWEEALDSIGRTIREFREDRARGQHSRGSFSYYVTKDYDVVKGFFGKGGAATPQGSIFGLPHQFQFSSTGEKVMIKGNGDIDRRASPLHIRVFRAGNKYYIGVQVFKSQFLREDLEFQDLDKKGHKATVKAPTYKPLDDFIASLKGYKEIDPWKT